MIDVTPNAFRRILWVSRRSVYKEHAAAMAKRAKQSSFLVAFPTFNINPPTLNGILNRFADVLVLVGHGLFAVGDVLIIAMAKQGINQAMAKKPRNHLGNPAATVPKPQLRGRPSLGGGGRTENRTLRVDDERWEAWRAAAERDGKKLAEWIRETLDREASVNQRYG